MFGRPTRGRSFSDRDIVVADAGLFSDTPQSWRYLAMHEPLPHRTAVQTDVAVAHILFRDIETRSKVSLKKVGAHKYAADPSTEVLCVAYAVDDGPVQLWRPGDPVPPEFFEAAADPNLGCRRAQRRFRKRH